MLSDFRYIILKSNKSLDICLERLKQFLIYISFIIQKNLDMYVIFHRYHQEDIIHVWAKVPVFKSKFYSLLYAVYRFCLLRFVQSPVFDHIFYLLSIWIVVSFAIIPHIYILFFYFLSLCTSKY